MFNLLHLFSSPVLLSLRLSQVCPHLSLHRTHLLRGAGGGVEGDGDGSREESGFGCSLSQAHGITSFCAG
jgi:hypothetical protein